MSEQHWEYRKVSDLKNRDIIAGSQFAVTVKNVTVEGARNFVWCHTDADKQYGRYEMKFYQMVAVATSGVSHMDRIERPMNAVIPPTLPGALKLSKEVAEASAEAACFS